VAGKQTAAAIAASSLLAACLTGCGSDAGMQERRLLTYHSSGVHATALISGVLGVSLAGCVTVGDRILVVPYGATTTLMSITVQGREYRFGTRVEFGGGELAAPPDTPCGSSARYWWV
jgi:hypothetical protein